MAEKHYWVYMPDYDEAGLVVEATSLEDAFRKGCYGLDLEDGDRKVQVYELGEGREFYVEEGAESEIVDEPTGDDYLKAKAFLIDLADRKDTVDTGAEITRFLDACDTNGVVSLAQAARTLQLDPKVSSILGKIKFALLGGA